MYAVVLVLSAYIYKTSRARRGIAAYARALKRSYTTLPRTAAIGVMLLLLVGIGMFSQRYAVNLVLYRTPVPSCDSVLDVDTCEAYGPWARDYHHKQAKLASGDEGESSIGATIFSPFKYFGTWLYGMWYRLFFMINGNLPVGRYQNSPSLPIIGGTAVVIGALGLLALGRFWRQVVRGVIPWLFVVTIGCYVFALWWQNFSSYRHTGYAVAVNGRYLLPILVLLGALMVAGIRHATQRLEFRSAMAVLSLMAFLSGNSLVSFVLRSQDTWYWQDHTIQTVNHDAKKLLDPIVWDEPTGHPLPQP